MTQETLVAAVYAAIAMKSTEQADRFQKSFYENHRCSALVLAQGEVNALNYYWRLELGCMRKNTVEERSCLIDGEDSTVWLGNFIETVLPTIISERLPRT